MVPVLPRKRYSPCDRGMWSMRASYVSSERLTNLLLDYDYLDRRLNWKKHIFTESENNLEFNWAKCTGCSAANRNCRPKISCCCTRRSLNLSEPMASSCGPPSPTQTWKCYKDFKTDASELLRHLWLYIMILTLETRLKDSARDTPIGWRNILIYSRLISWKKSKQHADWKENYLKIYASDRTVTLYSILNICSSRFP